ncbi:hypothetical protein [Streptomyces sp. SYP-A7185]|uniref:hypothetical protein n=1 Tax=Streptomyces sp. SYP-A7185 TaxID=3040076 RepID=UPI0038F7DA4B
MAVNGESVPDDEREAGHGVLPEDELLPCGRELSYVWERWESGVPDPHADDCPHCTRALDALRLLEGVVTQARDEAPREREQDTSALAGRVMDVVRLELRPGRTLPLGGEDEDAWIVEAAAARTVRAAAESLPGVRAGSCRIGPLDESAVPAPAGRLARGPVRIRVEVQVPLTVDLPVVADRVRKRILDAVDDELGMPVAVVDVTIGDLIDDGDDGDGHGGRGEGGTEGRQR